MDLEPIGIVHNRVKDPRPDGWGRVESEIELRAGLEGATEGLDCYSHVTVVFLLHRVPAERRVTRLRVAKSIPEQGILATRSQLRPAPIGVTTVPLLSVSGPRLKVRGLDAIDGSPVFDIRPYIPFYDSVPDAGVPEWARPPDGR